MRVCDLAVRVGRVVVVLIMAGPVFGQAARGPAGAGPVAPPKVVRVLELWERQSATNQAVEARFSLVRPIPALDVEERYEGVALLLRPDRVDVSLDRVSEVAGKTRRLFDQRVVATGRSVYYFSRPARQVVVSSRDAEGGQPVLRWELLTMVFEVKAAELLTAYRVALVKETSKSYYLQLVPRERVTGGELERLDVVLDRSTLLPTYLRLVGPRGADAQTFRFTHVARNAALTEADFRPPALKGWSVVDLTLPDAPKAPPAGSRLPPPIVSTPAPAPPGGR